MRAVVDAAVGAKRLCAGELFVARGRYQHACPSETGKLQGECRDAAGTEQQHGVSEGDTPDIDESAPGRYRRARKGHDACVGEMRKYSDGVLLVEHREFSEHAVRRR